MGRTWGDLPVWKLWKAQLWQESRLASDVCSAAGACGIAQFMAPTWRGVLREIGYAGDEPRSDARLAIAAGAYYQAKLRRSWRAEGRGGLARNDLGAASYNAGLGSILKAQAACGEPRDWSAIAPCLEQITGPDHAGETTGYVANIRKWWRMMEAAN